MAAQAAAAQAAAVKAAVVAAAAWDPCREAPWSSAAPFYG
jgi:hypothetical protein